MDLQDGIETSESRFAAYVETLASALGHADRVAPLKAYCTGLLLPGDRKSVEPMAARVEPGRVQAAHQSLHHFVAKADWSDDAVLGIVRAQVLPALERQGPIRAWIVDDTGFPRKGSIRSVWRGSIAANSASRTTAKIPWEVNSGRRSGKVRLR